MLKVNAQAINNTVVFQILEQDEKDINEECDDNPRWNFIASNGFRIKSRIYPEINENLLYIRGGCSQDDTSFRCKEFKSAEEAKRYITKMKQAIDEFNKQGGFKQIKRVRAEIRCEAIYTTELEVPVDCDVNTISTIAKQCKPHNLCWGNTTVTIKN